MSKRAELRREARAAEKARDDDTYGVSPAWCLTELDVPEAKQRTHDTLLRLMGDRRRGPVEWIVVTGPDANIMCQSMAQQSTSPEGRAVYDAILDKLIRQRGWFVVAVAKGQMQ